MNLNVSPWIPVFTLVTTSFLSINIDQSKVIHCLEEMCVPIFRLNSFFFSRSYTKILNSIHKNHHIPCHDGTYSLMTNKFLYICHCIVPDALLHTSIITSNVRKCCTLCFNFITYFACSLHIFRFLSDKMSKMTARFIFVTFVIFLPTSNANSKLQVHVNFIITSI